MKKNYLLFFLLLIAAMLQAQDIDFYLKDKNSNFDLPQIPEGMTFQEFRLLSHDLRMMDMAYAAVVPGYVHFVAQEKKTGYALLGVRMVGYSTLAYLAYFSDQNLDLNNINTNTKIAYAAIGLVVSSYLYDWIHGKYILEKKQDTIRYKYAPRLSFAVSSQYSSPVFGLRLTF